MRKLFYLATAVITAAALFTGCTNATIDISSPATSGNDNKTVGSFTLSVNPDIKVSYDDDADVTALTALNEDGATVLEGYTGYIGEDCDDVVKTLINRIESAGFIKENAQIVVSFDENSKVPETDDDFVEDLKEEITEFVKSKDNNVQVNVENVPVADANNNSSDDDDD